MTRSLASALIACALLAAACSDGTTDEVAATAPPPVQADNGTTTAAAVTTEAPTSTTTAATTTTAAMTTTPPVPAPLEGPRVLENGDFETGDLTGWMTEEIRDGEWLIYDDGQTQPDPKYETPDHAGTSNLGMDFDLPDPPQGLHAAVTDSASGAGGVRFLYRDIDVTEPYVLHVTVFYRNSWTAIRDPGHFKLHDEKQAQWYQNQQYRVEIIDPSAPIETAEPDDIWGTVYKTEQGDPASLEPTRVTFDLSPWMGETVRLRLTSIDHVYGPMRAAVDDVDVRVAG